MIYSHIEFVTFVFQFIGLPSILHHLKLLILLFFVYITENRHDWLSHFYNKVIFYDKVIINLSNSLMEKISEELVKLNHEHVK